MRGLRLTKRPWIATYNVTCTRHYTIAGRDLSRPVQSYICKSNDPYLNLSLEHHILQHSDPSSTVLCLYVNRPCVVIGRNQNPWTEVNLALLKRLSHARDEQGGDSAARSHLGLGDLKTVDLVRRRSGGGTVFHDDGNVNWSVICPSESFTRDKHAEMVVRALRKLGIARSRVNERHDIVLDLGDETTDLDLDDTHQTSWTSKAHGTVKVSGSAYKLTRGRALHHGTALLNTPNLTSIGKLLDSPGKGVIESKGVASVRSPVANIGLDNEEFIEEVQAQFALLYGALGSTRAEEIGEEWLEDARLRKGHEELKSLDWTYGQTPRFSLRSDGLFLEAQNAEIKKLELDGQDCHPSISELLKIQDWARFLENSSPLAGSASRILAARLDELLPFAV